MKQALNKRVLRLQQMRQVPSQFSWIDQALVQRHQIDRCDARTAALYLFLVTVAGAQGPWGQRSRSRYPRQASSLPNHSTNSFRSRGWSLPASVTAICWISIQ
jgi:hypothetical protein